MRRYLFALAAMLAATSAYAGNALPKSNVPPITPDKYDRLVPRAIAIQGCMIRVKEIEAGADVPEWLARNEDELRDIWLTVKTYDNGKRLLMGASVDLCMTKKRYWNKCIADEGNYDGDVQQYETALVSTCWTRDKPRAEAPTEKEKEKIVYVDKPVYIEKIVEKIVYVDKPVYVEKKVYVDKIVEVEKIVYVDRPLPPPPRGPDFTANDLDELRLDVEAVNSGRVVPNPLDKFGRLRQCTIYYRDEGTIRRDNRTQEAYPIVVASKLERCMAVTGWRNTCASFTNVGDPTSLSMNDWEGFTRASNNPNCYRR
jgi:hypothetical protein